MVTVTAYKHLMLERSLDGTAPTFLGPMLVHQRKLKESYHYLISSFIGAHPPPLSRILAQMVKAIFLQPFSIICHLHSMSDVLFT